jgi:hypothetical protein
MSRALGGIPRFAAVLACLFACGPSSGGDGGSGDGDGGSTGDGGVQIDNECPNGTSTSLRGRVVAPNGVDPIPFARVYVPTSVAPFPEGVSCELCSETGSALVSTMTEVDGSFVLDPIPTTEGQQPGETITLVAQKGRFRQVETVTINQPCGENGAPEDKYALPGKNDGDDTVPKIAVVTGMYDVMECVLRDLGMEQGSFDLYNGINAPIVGGTPGTKGQFSALLGDLETMKQYNIIFINCSQNDFENQLTKANVRSNIDAYVSAGGRLYVTDWSYDYLEQIPALAPIIDFAPSQSGDAPEARNQAAVGKGGLEIGASVLDEGMASWLEAVEEVTGDEIIDEESKVHIEHFLVDWVMQLQVPTRDTSKVWLEGPVSGGGVSGVRPLTTTYDHAECGRVLYSSYHTAGGDRLFPNDSFPGYCSGNKLSPQERVLLYLILHVADCIDIVE